MKLFELIGVKKYADKTFYHVVADMVSSNSFKKLGSGGFSCVFEDKDGNVIKFWIDDPAYEAYLKLTEKHPNKHWPKLGKTGELKTFFKYDFPGINRDDLDRLKKIKYVYLEKLEPLSTEEYDNFESFFKWWHNIKSHATTLTQLETDLKRQLSELGDKDPSHSQLIRSHVEWALKKILEKKDFLEGLFLIQKLIHEESDVHWDIHQINVMKRSDGTLVITDPLYSQKACSTMGELNRASKAETRGGDPEKVRTPKRTMESLDSPAEYEVTKQTVDYFAATAQIKGRTITFVFDRQRRDEWEGMFGEGAGHVTFKETGKGGALQVFATFKAVLTEFLERYTPQEVYFTAAADRGKLYQRIFDRYKFSKYDLTQHQHTSRKGIANQGDYVFTLIRKD